MERVVTILNEEGLHARPAGLLAKRASEFKSKIEVRSGGLSKNAKSIMGLMTLGLEKNSEIVLFAEGEDASQALDALADLVNKRFVSE